jgi:hypothetical protein
MAEDHRSRSRERSDMLEREAALVISNGVNSNFRISPAPLTASGPRRLWERGPILRHRGYSHIRPGPEMTAPGARTP